MSVVDNNKMLTDFIKIAVSQEQLIAVTMPTLPRIAYVHLARTEYRRRG